MYPGDEQTHNQNSMPEPPQPFVYGQPTGPAPIPPSKKPHEHKDGPNIDLIAWLPWIVCGFLLLVTIIFGILLALNSGKDDKTGTTNTPDQSEVQPTDQTACTSKQRRYKNEDLGLGFCYPSTWGDVSISDGQFDPSDSGTRVKLSFADKSQVHVGLVSDDWSSGSGHVETCPELGAQAFPDTDTFSANWITVGTGPAVTSATRGLEVVPDKYLTQEHVDNSVTKGVCMQGFMAINAAVYRNVAASYYAPFSGKITTPAAHITSPTQLINASDRADFITFVKSIYKL